MNGIAILSEHIDRDVCNIVQDYLVSDNTKHMRCIIDRIKSCEIWRIIDNKKKEGKPWCVASDYARPYMPLWSQVQLNITLLDRRRDMMIEEISVYIPT